MKHTLASFIFTTLLLGGYLQSYSQYKDYIVTPSNDTIYGKMKTSIFGGKKKLEAKDTSIECDQKSVISYYDSYNDGLYRSVLLPGNSKPDLLKCIQDGKIKLYAYYTRSGYGSSAVTTTTWYIQKDNSEAMELKTSALFGNTARKDRKDAFGAMLADNVEILKQYEEMGSFRFKAIYKLIQDYNQQAKNSLNIP